ncbi:hypothetical protein HOS95_gp51 [Salmonella phage vB_SpuP_Spp16]|uniref:Uncharacterized protein n=1 Tax=Salmonella phage vB_SpuP_Spp16 TaxID=2081603 RepID=A0A2P9JZU4_9CAUD|nr:hypothetical protein HOS95_gp51 [Salmonella phage vB_SpuP_Spp16]AVI05061.1 hypothetical protein [Salmonella phage vB_SpuP_Spp16]
MREPLVVKQSLTNPVVIEAFSGDSNDVIPYSIYLLQVIYNMNEDRVTVGKAIKEHNK